MLPVFPGRKTIFLLLLLLSSSTMRAQLRLPGCFSDHMVLQRDKPLPVWGTGVPGSKVTVSFAGKTAAAVADTAGKWMVVLNRRPASAQPAVLLISDGNTEINYTDVLVGDVWLCGGQSNMEYPMDRRIHRYAAPAKGADSAALELAHPDPAAAIRYLYVEKNLKKKPMLPTRGWAGAQDTILRYISAAGYFFAKEVHAATGIPIGIIHDNWGGTRIEPWTPDWAYRQSGSFSSQATTDTFRIDGTHPGQMYDALIEPLVPYAIRGILWYQGESNCMIDDQATYPEKFRLWLSTWRSLFRDRRLPCYYVQIAPHTYTKRKTNRPVTGPESLPLTWEAQARSLSLAHTGMVVTTDLVDNLADIHPSYKWTVGHRLALQALANTYGQKDVVYSGPVYRKMKRGAGSITLYFDHAGSGLTSRDGESFNWFTIAGADGVFVPATARISGHTVVVSATAVPDPRQVRFAWNETAQPNFCNREGLPAQPFRTDVQR